MACSDIRIVEVRESDPPRPAGGPGTELTRLLKWLGLGAEPGCACQRHAEEMDERGPAWCRAHVETIVDWLAEEAARQGRLFVRPAAKLIVQLAVRRAERKGSRVEG